MTAYRLDNTGRYTGVSFELPEDGGYHGYVTFTAPPALAAGEAAIWSEGAWTVIDIGAAELAARKAAMVESARALCQAAILGGFASSALGAVHRYPSLIADQINLMGSVTDSLLPGLPGDRSTPFWCADEAGLWAMRAHSAAQIQQAGQDGKAHVLSRQLRLDALFVEIVTAADHAALDAVDIETGWA